MRILAIANHRYRAVVDILAELSAPLSQNVDFVGCIEGSKEENTVCQETLDAIQSFHLVFYCHTIYAMQIPSAGDLRKIEIVVSPNVVRKEIMKGSNSLIYFSEDESQWKPILAQALSYWVEIDCSYEI